jgi:uncharacterized protein YecA (UPF0149 family)
MRFYKHDVERLAQLLSSSDATQRIDMKLSELDGYLTAVFLCPEFVPPSSWLTDLFKGKVPEKFHAAKLLIWSLKILSATSNTSPIGQRLDSDCSLFFQMLRTQIKFHGSLGFKASTVA